MPRLNDSDNEMTTYQIGSSGFSFSGARIGDLGATEYTLVTIAIDVTGSVTGFEDELRQMLITAVEACQRSPRSDNLLVRLITFSSGLGVNEIHGFTPLSSIDPQAYPRFAPNGLTNLYDATFSAVTATVKYGEDLMDSDFLANGIVFIVTDGYDNTSTMTAASIAQQCNLARTGEKLESLVTILIGVNARDCNSCLDRFKTEAELDQYIDAGDATPAKLAKLAAFVSQSVSSQSQALGTGGPSQAIAATI